MRDQWQVVLAGEQLQLGEAGHAPVVEHELAEHAGGVAPGQAGEVDGRLGVAGSFDHPVGAGAQREDVAGSVEHGAGVLAGRPALAAWRHGRRRRCRWIVPSARSTVTVNAVRNWSAFAAGGTISGSAERVATLAGQCRADDARGVPHEERDGLGRGGIGGHDQVALVLAVLVVGHHDDAAGGDGGDRRLDAVEHAHDAPSEQVPRIVRPASRRSTYLAITSTSMFTRSPGCLRPSVVTADGVRDDGHGEAVGAWASPP